MTTTYEITLKREATVCEFVIMSVPSMSFGWLLNNHVAIEVDARVVQRQLTAGWSVSPQLNFQLLGVN